MAESDWKGKMDDFKTNKNQNGRISKSEIQRKNYFCIFWQESVKGEIARVTPWKYNNKNFENLIDQNPLKKVKKRKVLKNKIVNGRLLSGNISP